MWMKYHDMSVVSYQILSIMYQVMLERTFVCLVATIITITAMNKVKISDSIFVYIYIHSRACAQRTHNTKSKKCLLSLTDKLSKTLILRWKKNLSLPHKICQQFCICAVINVTCNIRSSNQGDYLLNQYFRFEDNISQSKFEYIIRRAGKGLLTVKSIEKK